MKHETLNTAQNPLCTIPRVGGSTVSVNSISGGKTSAFMALNYPADIELFALVCIEAEYCKPKDKGLVKFVSDKIGRDFVATAQLRKNWDDESQKMRWFAEKEMKRQWKKEMSYSSAKKIGLQQDFFFGTGSGCQAGFCTD